MKIYFMGICGTAMGNAALLSRAAGHEVLGADSGVYPPMSTVLEKAGISLHDGYDAARLARLAPDLVVIGNAMSRGNPEVEWLLSTRQIPFTSLPASLHEQVLARRKNLVICGTHGKTTTTALTAYLLRSAGKDPGFLIGGVPQDPPVGSHLGSQSDPFVIEGDEYDSAFFDKRSKFIHYAPHVAVLNNLEFDHADIFRDLADVVRTFTHLTRIVPANGFVVLNGDDPNLKALGAMPWTQVIRVGLSEGCDVRISGFSESPTGSTFTLQWRDTPWAQVSWGLTGLYNARNAAMAATAAGLALDPVRPSALSLSALASFRGVKRRQEILLSLPNLTVIEDFGHHPTALAETLRSLRNRFPGFVISAAFEPRSNTARTKVLEGAFQEALGLADEVYLGPVNRGEKLAIAERFDAPGVAAALRGRGLFAEAYPDNEALLAALTGRVRSSGERPRLVAFFTNGSFDGIIARCVAALRG